jgi:hypothetical protein
VLCIRGIPVTLFAQSPTSWKIWVVIWTIPIVLSLIDIEVVRLRDVVHFTAGTMLVALMFFKPSFVLLYIGLFFTWHVGDFIYFLGQRHFYSNAYLVGLLAKEIIFILYLLLSSNAKAHRAGQVVISEFE